MVRHFRAVFLHFLLRADPGSLSLRCWATNFRWSLSRTRRGVAIASNALSMATPVPLRLSGFRVPDQGAETSRRLAPLGVNFVGWNWLAAVLIVAAGEDQSGLEWPGGDAHDVEVLLADTLVGALVWIFGGCNRLWEVDRQTDTVMKSHPEIRWSSLKTYSDSCVARSLPSYINRV